MGTADAVPGVSGGTIALITGIYQRLISALSSPDLEKLREGFEAVKQRDLSEIVNLMKDMDVPFVLVLGLGVVSALTVVLNLMERLLQSNPVPVYGFFTGLIIFSAILIYREVKLDDIWSKISAFTGFTLALSVSGIGATSLGHSGVVLFLSGAVAISAMILPGISGSLLLVILGQYEYMSGVVSSTTDSVIELFSGGSINDVIEAGSPATVFVAGAFTGIFTMVRIVEKALERNREATMAFLVSLMVGAIRAPILQVDRYLQAQNLVWINVVQEFALAVILGASTIFILDRKTMDIVEKE